MTPIYIQSIGAVLVAFQYMDKFGHLICMILLPILIPLHNFYWLIKGRPHFNISCPNTWPKPIQILGNTFIWILATSFFLFLFTVGTVVILGYFISRLPPTLNDWINTYYRWGIRKMKRGIIYYEEIIFELYNSISPKRIKITEEKIESALEKIQIPFIAIVGLILIIIGFIWQLI